MLRTLLLMSLIGVQLLFFQATRADSSVDPRQDFCKGYKTDPFFFKNRIKDPEASWGFPNFGGIEQQGVCWWRTRLQWINAHLVIYRPDLPKPSPQQVWKLFHKIAHGDRIVEISGYGSFFDFTVNNDKIAENFLEMFQLYDGAVRGGWVGGIKGKPYATPQEMKAAMDGLYDYVVKKNNVAYVFLQIKGAASHTISVVDVRATPRGYHYVYVDSNHPQQIDEKNYKFSDTQWPFWDGVMFYIRKQKQLEKMHKIVAQYCRQFN